MTLGGRTYEWTNGKAKTVCFSEVYTSYIGMVNYIFLRTEIIPWDRKSYLT